MPRTVTFDGRNIDVSKRGNGIRTGTLFSSSVQLQLAGRLTTIRDAGLITTSGSTMISGDVAAGDMIDLVGMQAGLGIGNEQNKATRDWLPRTMQVTSGKTNIAVPLNNQGTVDVQAASTSLLTAGGLSGAGAICTKAR